MINLEMLNESLGNLFHFLHGARLAVGGNNSVLEEAVERVLQIDKAVREARFKIMNMDMNAQTSDIPTSLAQEELQG